MRVEPCKCQRLQALGPECKRSTACFGAFYFGDYMIDCYHITKITELERTLLMEELFKSTESSKSKRGLVNGFGINDAEYITQPRINGRQVVCPAYQDWVSIIKRAHSKKAQERNPTYIGVVVCDEWMSFTSFRSWWIENQVDGWQIDKDILGNGYLYSPSSCIYIPSWLNTFIIDSGSARGNFKIGVHLYKASGKYASQCNNPISKKREHLGYFEHEDDAYVAWLTRKLEIASYLKIKMDEIDYRIYPRVVEIIMKAR